MAIGTWGGTCHFDDMGANVINKNRFLGQGSEASMTWVPISKKDNDLDTQVNDMGTHLNKNNHI